MKKRYPIWTLEALNAEAAKYETRAAMRNGSNSAFQTAEKKKLLDVIFARHQNGGRFVPRKKPEARKYSDADLIEIAGPHRFIIFDGYFDEGDAATRERLMIAYYREAGWKVLNVMAGGGLGNTGKWNRGNLIPLARSFPSRRAFQLANKPAYKAAHRQGILDETVADHPNAGFCSAVMFRARG